MNVTVPAQMSPKRWAPGAAASVRTAAIANRMNAACRAINGDARNAGYP